MVGRIYPRRNGSWFSIVGMLVLSFSVFLMVPVAIFRTVYCISLSKSVVSGYCPIQVVVASCVRNPYLGVAASDG